MSSERGGGASAPSPHRFSPAARNYLEGHAVDLDLAHRLGVRSDRDDLLYP